MNISSRIRVMTVIAVSALALGVGGFAAPAHAAETGSVSYANPDVIFVGNPFWTTTTPGVSAFAIPAAGCTPGCLHMWNRDPYGNLQASALNVYWYVNGNLQMHDKLVIQTDGNFVFYVSNGKVWAPNPTVRPNGYSATFQPDGNLVVRNSAGKALWASNTHTYPNAFLAVQSDGNLVIYDSRSDMKALWATGTNS
jgi:hypothetical protein